MQRIIALLLFILLLPLILFTGLLSALGNGLPFIFIQERIGKNKVPFTIYKFKTMRNGQITIIGGILRKTGLDELPQLINIIEGSMRFVGPRPLMQSDIDRLEWNGSKAEKRWNIHPGITGPAQLVNICDKDISLSNDLYYVENRSIGLDFKILWKSLLVPIMGKSNAKSIIHR